MTQKTEAVSSKDDTLTDNNSRADWHPYSVWRDQIRSDTERKSAPEQQNIELTGSWQPFSVWKRQIKRA